MSGRADLLARLATPPGLPGSGRLRYGAAMGLHASGDLSDAALEIFRVAAAHDGWDPALLLAEAHLPPPPRPAQGGEGPIRALVDEIDRHLARTDGPGVAEVRQGLNAARGGMIRPVPAKALEVVGRHLPVALAALALDHPALSLAIAAAGPHLAWQRYDAYGPAIGRAFAEGHAFATLIGSDAPLSARDFDLGLFLIAPQVLYRDHAHPAPELYLPLTGPHGWRFAPGGALHHLPAHRPVWNPPLRPHLTKVGALPFLSIFAWTRDVDRPAHILPAPDWPALEALVL